MHPADLVRELQKAHVALAHAAAYLQRHNEANAVLHLASPGGVMYSPLTTEVVNAHRTLGTVIERLAQEASEPDDVAAAIDRPYADTGDAPEVPMRWDGKPAIHCGATHPLTGEPCAVAEPHGPDDHHEDVAGNRWTTNRNHDQRCTLCGAVNPDTDLCPSDESGGHVLEPARSTDG